MNLGTFVWRILSSPSNRGTLLPSDVMWNHQIAGRKSLPHTLADYCRICVGLLCPAFIFPGTSWLRNKNPAPTFWKKFWKVFRFYPSFCNKGGVGRNTRVHSAKCIEKRGQNCATIWKKIIFRKSGKKGRSRCLQSEGTFSRRSNCIWKTVWNCAFFWKWKYFRKQWTKPLSRCLDLEGLLSCSLTIEYHPTAYAPGEVRDDMSVPMTAIRRQPPAGRAGCSAFPTRILLPLFQKPLERTWSLWKVLKMFWA